MAPNLVSLTKRKRKIEETPKYGKDYEEKQTSKQIKEDMRQHFSLKRFGPHICLQNAKCCDCSFLPEA